jgi:hypothetical protein
VIGRWAKGEHERSATLKPHHIAAISSAMATATTFAAEAITCGHTDKMLVKIIAKQIHDSLALAEHHYDKRTVNRNK